MRFGGILSTAAGCCLAVALAWTAVATSDAGPALGPDASSGRWSVVPPARGTTNVSCRSAVDCFEAGADKNGPKAARWDGSRWVGSLRMPMLDSERGLGFLNGVVCPTTAECLAAGTIGIGGGLRQFLMRWDGTTWQRLSVPREQAVVDALACAAPDDCWAVGQRVRGSLDRAAFAEHWNGSSWASTRVPHSHMGRIKGAGPGGGDILVPYALESVSCAKADMCMAVGRPGYGYFGQSVFRWNGRKWIDEKLTPPRPRYGLNGLHGVSCPSGNFCMAVGGGATLQSYRWNGRDWAKVTISGPTKRRDSFGPDLRDVACLSSTDCVATGVKPSAKAEGPLLVQRWNGRRWRAAPDRGRLSAATCRVTETCVLTP